MHNWQPDVLTLKERLVNKRLGEPMSLGEWWTSWLNARLYRVIALLVLSGLLTACATRSPGSTPVQPPAIPKPPASLMKPVPPESFSAAAARNTQEWQRKLTSSETK